MSNAFTSARNGASTAPFVVCSKDADNKNKLDPDKGLITPVVPKYPYGHENIPADSDPDAKGTQVGEPVMFFPNGNISLSIDLKQYVEDTKDETDGDKITYKEVEKLDIRNWPGGFATTCRRSCCDDRSCF